jgi:2-C-methyl-D-erythritol 4-phosphate cytidylyltransferase
MNPVLFLLMRTDLNSLNSGKAMAQAAHAGNAFETAFEAEMQSSNTTLHQSYYEWKTQTPQGFGTTIVLGASMAQIRTDVEWLKRNNFMAEIIHDPTYPLVDGSVTHLIPLDTCAYVFAPNKDEPYLKMVLSKYSLHP